MIIILLLIQGFFFVAYTSVHHVLGNFINIQVLYPQAQTTMPKEIEIYKKFIKYLYKGVPVYSSTQTLPEHLIRSLHTGVGEANQTGKACCQGGAVSGQCKVHWDK